MSDMTMCECVSSCLRVCSVLRILLVICNHSHTLFSIGSLLATDSNHHFWAEFLFCVDTTLVPWYINQVLSTTLRVWFTEFGSSLTAGAYRSLLTRWLHYKSSPVWTSLWRPCASLIGESPGLSSQSPHRWSQQGQTIAGCSLEGWFSAPPPPGRRGWVWPEWSSPGLCYGKDLVGWHIQYQTTWKRQRTLHNYKKRLIGTLSSFTLKRTCSET